MAQNQVNKTEPAIGQAHDLTEAESSTPSVPIKPYTMILDQSSHLDWDWVRSFSQYFWYGKGDDVGAPPKGVQAILDQAITNLQEYNPDGKRLYYYAICEMSFLQKYVEENPSQVPALLKAGDSFQVIGGGVTSPDCLVCSGEGFIRNYLIGHHWLSQALPGVPARRQCWIPDDFGQSPELPVLLQALGFVGVGFYRIPGDLYGPLAQTLRTEGLDFVWQASDRSQVIVHWIGANYSIGDQLDAKGAEAIQNPFLTAVYEAKNGTPPQYWGAVTAAMYIPIAGDFSTPVGGLPAMIDQWNNNQVEGGAAKSNVRVAAGTFDGFIAELVPSQGALKKRSPYSGTPFVGIPYWTGYYASRPALKILHYRAMRALVAAEIFGLLTEPGNRQLKNMLPRSFWSDLAATWTDFAPSTHHDYVCGTASDATYATEQLPFVQAVADRAVGLRAAALNALAGNTPSPGERVQILVANSLGFPRQGLAEIEHVVEPHVQSVSFDDGKTNTPLQVSAEGGMLFMSSLVPSFGYVSGSLRTDNGQAASTASITKDGDGYVLENDRLKATINESTKWGIFSLIDERTKNEVLDWGPDFAPGNDLIFYQDGGDIYQFGNEFGETFNVDRGISITTAGPGLGAIVLESGPLRVRLRTTVLVTAANWTRYFTREYTLVAGEPFLRMSTTGAAPLGYSVMTRFSLAREVAFITHGTAGHWTSVQPLNVWGEPAFRATQDFLIPEDKQHQTLAAIYHEAVPAWAFDEKGNLIGCLFRNTWGKCDRLGARGTDPAPHTQHYALRVPSNLGAPATGQPLREAQAYHTPLQAVEIPAGDKEYKFDGMNSGSWSLAAAFDPVAILSVAKPGSFDPKNLILRVYQPTNASLPVQVKVGRGRPASVKVVTAAEGEWAGPQMPIQSTDDGFKLIMNAAIATVQIDGLGLP